MPSRGCHASHNHYSMQFFHNEYVWLWVYLMGLVTCSSLTLLKVYSVILIILLYIINGSKHIPRTSSLLGPLPKKNNVMRMCFGFPRAYISSFLFILFLFRSYPLPFPLLTLFFPIPFLSLSTSLLFVILSPSSKGFQVSRQEAPSVARKWHRKKFPP